MVAIIHGRYKIVPRTIDLELLTAIATLADKYQASGIFDLILPTWLEPLELYQPTSYDPRVGRWIYISWVFGLEPMFTRMTEFMIRQMTDNIDEESVKFVQLPTSLLGQSKSIDTLNGR